MRTCFLALFIFISGSVSLCQSPTHPVNGTANQNHTAYAFTNALIWVDPMNVITGGTLLIRDGKIVEVGTKVTIPSGTVVYDLKGKSIYPSLIDPFTTYGMPEVKREPWSPNPQMDTKTKGAHNWNQAIKPELNAADFFVADQKFADEMRRLGFGTVQTIPRDGIARGTGACVILGTGKENELIISGRSSQNFSFEKGSSSQEYPGSLMGSIALLRQTYLDALWYKENKGTVEFNLSLDAWNSNMTLPQIFETRDKLSVLRADKVGDEFKVQFIFKGSGNEYQRIDEVKATNGKFILPLNFPLPYDVEDPYDALLVSLEDMKHWEMAPLNPSACEQRFITFAFTTADLKDKKEFWKNLRKAIAYGLSERTALKALTVNAAEMLGISDLVGTLRPGMLANFIITSGNLFDEKNIIYENWVKGVPYTIQDPHFTDLRGNYELSVNNKVLKLKISGEPDKPKGSIIQSDSVKIPVTFLVNDQLLTITFDHNGWYRLGGSMNADGTVWQGKGQLFDGSWVEWVCKRTSGEEEKKPQDKKGQELKIYPTLDDVIYPFNAYGVTKKDSSAYQKWRNRWGAILIKNVTVWTNEPDGILKNKDVLIVEGKIVRIGENLGVPATVKAIVIDGTGKHLSPGIIDEHSHIGISGGVNEGTQSSSAEVKIGDVINCEDINIYRQLSGGVVACQLLHGSANPVGGQSGLIKLKWGTSPEEMKIKWADGFIKFALGENVKQSNWGDNSTIRFPQSRMGVEQVYFDLFIRAKEYEKRMAEWNKMDAKTKSKSTPPRRDLELETIAEIMNKRRFISCHSYVQSEINMLMKVGDSMGFTVNTFTHILEGYKLADKMKLHGAGASSFSDWWAYKMEVKDAIPYNGAILWRNGVVTAFNSDDAEMGRRLNQEAGKAVKYGNVPKEDALKFVTLNPAILLHLDKKMGSIKPGKDGDVVLWTAEPLSIYAKVDKTIIEGTIYYDAEMDKLLREEIQKERARLIRKMLDEKNGGEKTQKPVKKEQKLYHCDDVEEYGAEEETVGQ
ncbi:MAG: amidohydrolase family protein [Bacteroidia bacterium]|nr:amidohydrolase family protein [Bacteroidia bacterium]